MVSLREMARADAERVPPAWLRPLLEAKFFEACPEHPDASRATRSGGCNRFCAVCAGGPLCHACVAGAEHAGHKLIQIRRSSNHNVVKAKDVKKVLNVDEVQPYHANGETVLFLKNRPQMGKGNAGVYRCNDCGRTLLHQAYRFCSLKCKLECMEWDLNVSFAVEPKIDSESSEDDAETAVNGAPSRPAKRLRNTRPNPPQSGRGNSAEGDGAGTSDAAAAAAAASLATLASGDPPSPGNQ